MTTAVIFRRALIVVLCWLWASLASAWQSDNGDGTFKNPVLYADYPAPDIIRVTNDFYMVSTMFMDSPGINVLHSKDLVNWEVVSHRATNRRWAKAAMATGPSSASNRSWWHITNSMTAAARLRRMPRVTGPTTVGPAASDRRNLLCR